MNNQPMKKAIYALMLLMFTLASCGNNEYVDLGLSVKWATCNVGATTPEGYGNYYNLKDACTYNLPTKDQMQELIDKCKWESTTSNGVKGVKVTGPNGNTVFMPCAGDRFNGSLNSQRYYGYYWSNTPYPDRDDTAFGLCFDNNGYSYVDLYYGRDYEFSVRPVSKL